jgi:hypothetical protein
MLKNESFFQNVANLYNKVRIIYILLAPQGADILLI